MRRRLIAALVGVALATLLLYAGPRAFMISDMVRDREDLGLERTADLFAEAIELRLANDLVVDDTALDRLLLGRDDLEVSVVLGDGSEARAGDLGGSTLDSVRTLSDGGELVVWLSDDAVDRRVADALAPVAAFAAAATVFAVAVADVLARRLARPFTRLAHHAELLGDDVAGPAPRAGVAEADELADALDRSQDRIAELLRAEREFSSNASHQLRTPLAALRLRIEDVSMWDETAAPVRDELEAALGEVDRLADTVTDLLELARSGGIGTGTGEVDLVRAAAGAVAQWADAFAEAGRRIVLAPHPSDAVAVGSERAVRHVLDVLFENALRHGAGAVDVTVQHLGDRVALRVADEGTFDRSVSERAFERSGRSASSTGSGIGLDLARTIAESAGARLTLASVDPTVLELAMPRPADAGTA